jgi:kynureninase
VKGIELCSEIGIDALYRKSQDLTGLLIDLYEQRLASRGFRLASPRRADLRGSHVTLVHDEAYRITRALIDAGVIPDYRDPGAIRFGVAPSYISATQVWDAVQRLVTVMDTGSYETYDLARERVT